MLYGEGFGATAGAIAGGLTALSTKKPEHILLGSSIGVLSGAALGAVFGFFEGGHARAHGAPEPDRMSLSVVPVVEAGGKLAYLPALSGRY
jgi:phage tail tape-measure protein